MFAPNARGSPGCPEVGAAGVIDGGAESLTMALISRAPPLMAWSITSTASPSASTPTASRGASTWLPEPSWCGGPKAPPARAKLASAAAIVLRHATTMSPRAPIAATGVKTFPVASGCVAPHGPPAGSAQASTARVAPMPRFHARTPVPAGFMSKASSSGPLA